MACAALALALSTPALAQKKKAKAVSKALPAHLAALDTLRPVSAEEFSYALGMIQSDVQWRQYLQNNPTSDSAQADTRVNFTTGFMSSFVNKDSVTQDKAFSAGVSIAKMTDVMFINNKMYRLSLMDTANFFDTEAAQAGFVEALEDRARYSLDSAKALTLAQAPYYEAVKVANAARMMHANRQQNPDLKTTESGLQYRILTAGTGPRPTDSVEVKVHYEGRLFDGRVFDSSYERGEPATFGVTQVIKGWTEVLQMMPVGSTWEVFIPQELAYGVRGTKDRYNQETGQLLEEGIPAYAPLIFKIELIDIIKK